MFKILIYIPLFFLGVGISYFYFTNMVKNLSTESITKSQIIKGMILRLPVPVIGFFLAGFIAGIGGILSLFVGFTVFQIYFLVKAGSKLKLEIEKDNENLESKDNNKK